MTREHPNTAERDAQVILDYLYEECAEVEPREDGLYFKGSLHTLTRNIIGKSAQPAKLVNDTLVRLGAVLNIGRGEWVITRKDLFDYNDADVVEEVSPRRAVREAARNSDVPPYEALEGQIRDQSERYSKLVDAFMHLNEDQARIAVAVNEMRDKLGMDRITFGQDQYMEAADEDYKSDEDQEFEAAIRDQTTEQGSYRADHYTDPRSLLEDDE